jgi:hypothetical protein
MSTNLVSFPKKRPAGDRLTVVDQLVADLTCVRATLRALKSREEAIVAAIGCTLDRSAGVAS